jgi:hypothetical protein
MNRPAGSLKGPSGERERDGRARQVEAAQTDCLSCRVIGTVACWGSGAWIAFHAQGARGFHRGIGVAASSGLFVLGVARALME